MPTYQRCDESIALLAAEVLCRFETHKPTLDAKVKIDYIFAYADLDDKDQPINNALMHHGVPALGITRKLSLKDRAAGRGDAEICIDHDWWQTVDDEEHRGLLDHELHHIQVKTTRTGVIKRDDLGRPLLSMRQHDVQFGWFKIVAERNGGFSQERIGAKVLMDSYGQYFWPELVK